MSEIVLGRLPNFTVPLPDPATDAKRVYRPRPFTKSREREWEKAWIALLAHESKLDGKDELTDAERKKYVRLMCDCLTIRLVGGDVEAGDHLAALYEADVEGCDLHSIQTLLREVLDQFPT